MAADNQWVDSVSSAHCRLTADWSAKQRSGREIRAANSEAERVSHYHKIFKRICPTVCLATPEDELDGQRSVLSRLVPAI